MIKILRLSLLAISVTSLLTACTGETRPDKTPAPVEDRGIRVDSSEPVVLSRASEVAPMQQASPEPSTPKAAQSKPVVQKPQPNSEPAPQQALFQTVSDDEKATTPAPVSAEPDNPENEEPILSSRQFEKTADKAKNAAPVQAQAKTEEEQVPAQVALLHTQRGSGDKAPPAISALTADADRAIRSRDYDKAAASLERALRMEPRDSYLWHRLAYTRLQQGKSAQAESLALKSNSLAGDKQELVNSNWRLISRSRKQRNDLGGAEQALTQIR